MMDRRWQFIRFGTSSADDLNTIAPGSDVEGCVTLNTCTFDVNGDVIRKGGKFVADAPADGMSFYYTVIDPRRENFYLQADVRVDYINTAPDGQEGFALMVRDSIGGSGSYFSNLTAAGCSTHYFGDTQIKTTVGTRRFTGVVDNEASHLNRYKPFREAFDPENPRRVKAGDMYRMSLEKTSFGYITTQYEILPDGTTGRVIGTHVQYIPAKDASSVSVMDYDELDDPMCVQEPDKAYVALVCARGLNATFSRIRFEVSPWKAEEWKPQPAEYMDAACRITSPDCVPQDQYTLTFVTNADGKATVHLGGTVVSSGLPVEAGRPCSTVLTVGESAAAKVVFEADPQGKLPPFTILRSEEPVEASLMLRRRNVGAGGVVWTAPEGMPENDGSEQYPVDVQTALEFAAPGQMIRLKPETYDLAGRTLYIRRGVNGREDSPIVLTCLDGFATLDFGRTGGGFEAWGDWWQMSRINVKGTRHGSVGMKLAGWHNRLERMNFFNNGNTGLHVGGRPDETIDRWPSHNRIINCTSMNNADDGYEDADGFAAKVTNGVDNVFEGCLSAYNADDGWDMFAKAGTGSIGAVTMIGCVTMRNGYIMGKAESTKAKVVHADIDVDENGNLSFADWGGKDCIRTVAGNGNGFKMGGTNLPGAHKLINSISYENLARGIESNSGTDIQVAMSTSFNNGEENVAFFTENRCAVTDYHASGILSFRTDGGCGDRLRPQGQKTDLRGPYNCYWDPETATAHNKAEKETTVGEDWFISLDTSVLPSRRPDGSLDMHGLLLLTEEARSFGFGVSGKVWGQRM
ncbi:MAG: hypothetical protein IJ507_00985 [Clostridia bacterium]|nr:hypothetical protein [Clostridia bacterium]